MSQPASDSVPDTVDALLNRWASAPAIVELAPAARRAVLEYLSATRTAYASIGRWGALLAGSAGFYVGATFARRMADRRARHAQSRRPAPGAAVAVLLVRTTDRPQ